MNIKKCPEDFIVIEKSNVEIKENGDYSYFILKKKNYNTIDAIERVAKEFNVKKVGYAGNKDRNAITEQMCSIKGVSKEKIERVKLNDIELKFVGKGDVPISLGDLEGNYFEILVRDAKVPKLKSKFLNYFGEQRFGKNNYEVGKAIIKKDFKKACELLGIDNNNPVGSLTKINKKVLRIYVHAFQSKMWNEAIKILSGKNIEKVPLIGFGTEFENEEVKKVYEKIMNEEGITLRDFIIRQIPDLSSEGDEREIYAEAEDLKIEKKENNVLLKFFLKKGSYATSFIEQLFE